MGTPTRWGSSGPGAGQGHQPGLTLQDLVVAAAARLGTVMPETGDGQDHQGHGSARASPRREKPEPVQHAGAEVLNNDVGAFEQFAQNRPARRRSSGPGLIDSLLRLQERKYVA
jgi:hypothetical protein